MELAIVLFLYVVFSFGCIAILKFNQPKEGNMKDSEYEVHPTNVGWVMEAQEQAILDYSDEYSVEDPWGDLEFKFFFHSTPVAWPSEVRDIARDWLKVNGALLKEDRLLMPSVGNPVVDEDGNPVHLFNMPEAYFADERMDDVYPKGDLPEWRGEYMDLLSDGELCVDGGYVWAPRYNFMDGVVGWTAIATFTPEKPIYSTGFMSTYMTLVSESNPYPYDRLVDDLRGNYTKWLYLNDPDYAPMMWDNPF